VSRTPVEFNAAVLIPPMSRVRHLGHLWSVGAPIHLETVAVAAIHNQLGRDTSQHQDSGSPNVVDHWHLVLCMAVGLDLPRSHSSRIAFASAPYGASTIGIAQRLLSRFAPQIDAVHASVGSASSAPSGVGTNARPILDPRELSHAAALAKLADDNSSSMIRM
jgi:hypothetical protein